MTLYDSSVLIDFLAGDDDAIEYVEAHGDQRAVAPPIVFYEVYQGEVYKSGPEDFDAVDEALGWLTVVEPGRNAARAAGSIQAELQRRGVPLAARDAFIAGIAKGFDERLVVSDSDFEVDGLTDELPVDFL